MSESDRDRDELEMLLARHAAFWQRAPVDRPLVSHLPTRKWVPRPYPLRGGRLVWESQPIAPEDMDIERLIGLDQPRPALCADDMVNSIGPTYATAWLEAVAGCSIHVSAYGCVARPVSDSLDAALRTFSVERALDSNWMKLMDSVLDTAQAAAGSAYPVPQLHLRGVIDVLAAYLGEELLCMAVYDAPDKLARLADRMADLFLAVARRGFQHRRIWQNGYVSCWKLYAPGPLIDYQVDASSLFSPAIYAQHFAPHDRKILQAFPYSVTHLHGVGLHLLDVLLDIPGLRTVEVNFDREAGQWNKAFMLEACRRIQRHEKNLLIDSEFSEQEFREFFDALTPTGLAIDYWNPAEERT